MTLFEQPLLRVLFICRGSSSHGLGHVFRSQAVATEMAHVASVRMLVIGDEHMDGILVGQPFTYDVVPDEAAAWSHMERFGPQVVVLDLLQLQEERVRDICGAFMVVSLSPIFNGLNKVHMIFHRTRYFGSEFDETTYRGELRCGLDYAVVREQCERIPTDHYENNLRAQPLAIALSMGGADAGNKTLEVLMALRRIPEPMLFWVLLGEGYSHSYAELVDAVKKDSCHEIILAKTSRSMWRVLSGCAIVLLAGGTVTYEAAFAGLPSITLFDQANRVFLVRELVERGVCINAGFPVAEAAEVACARLRNLERDRARLLEMHHNCVGLLDGHAARRISSEIIRHYWSVFHPNPATTIAGAEKIGTPTPVGRVLK